MTPLQTIRSQLGGRMTPILADSARRMQRRLDAAVRYTSFSTTLLKRKAWALRLLRSDGDAMGLRMWLRDNRALLEMELRSAVRWRASDPSNVFRAECAGRGGIFSRRLVA